MTVPLLCASTRSASRRMAKCADRVDLAIGKCSASSPAFIGFLRSNCRICRRVGSDRALKTKFMFLYLAKYRILSSSWFQGHKPMSRDEELETKGGLQRRLERHSYDRLIILSDGVFAIAITLAAFEIKVPDGWRDLAELWGQLRLPILI